ncbi:lysozyme C, milk isozyme-like [Mobula birostris]|uniref:lysozyme C, milk isozyme-like n=1 Tax=Mobula birostris TaxID=1983395 RepID=UPI003B27C623
MKTLFLLSALLTVVSPRTYRKCELARELRGYGLGGYHGYSLEDWVCLVENESSYRTFIVNANEDSGTIASRDYGLFQINSKWWCEDGQTSNSHNVCRIQCSDLLDDDIRDDAVCAKRVVRNPRRMKAWRGWVRGCQRDLRNFLSECDL